MHEWDSYIRKNGLCVSNAYDMLIQKQWIDVGAGQLQKQVKGPQCIASYIDWIIFVSQVKH